MCRGALGGGGGLRDGIGFAVLRERGGRRDGGE